MRRPLLCRPFHTNLSLYETRGGSEGANREEHGPHPVLCNHRCVPNAHPAVLEVLEPRAVRDPAQRQRLTRHSLLDGPHDHQPKPIRAALPDSIL